MPELMPAAHGFKELAFFDAGGSPYFKWREHWNRTKPHFPTMPGTFRVGPHKLIWDWHGKLELYHIPNDPFENHYLSNSNTELTAELLDIFPTLIDLTGIPENPNLEGLSLVPQLRDASAKRERPAITSHNVGNHGIRSKRWRYIRYADGSEELYDILADPREWKNLAADPEHTAIIVEHKKWLPKKESPPTPGSATRILTYDAATDTAVWDGTPITRDDPIPE